MEKTYNTLLTIFIAFVFSSVFYLVIGFLLSRSQWRPVLGSGSVAQLMFQILLVVAVGIVVLVGVFKQKAFAEGMRRPENIEQLQRYVISRYVMFFALSETPSIFGLVHYLLTGSLLRLIIFCGISLASFQNVRPSLEFLNNLQRRWFLE